jgi:flagella basal body P-ring formation protein FlgA
MTSRVLETIPTIIRGQKVWLIAASPYLVVRMTGKALQDGAPGERIQVENTRSKRVVEGIVGNDGSVNIGL